MRLMFSKMLILITSPVSAVIFIFWLLTTRNGKNLGFQKEQLTTNQLLVSLKLFNLNIALKSIFNRAFT